MATRYLNSVGVAAFALVLAALAGLTSPLTVPVAAQAPARASGGATHALLINGGSQPESNYLSHLQHLQDMVALLGERGVAPEHIHVFSADGEDPAPDLTTRATTPPDFWLIEDTAIGTQLQPRARLVDTPWHAVKLHPARLADLRQWFETARNEIPPGDRLLVFVTDHGGQGRTSDPGSGTISLWKEKLTVREFRSMLDRLAPGVQVVTIMSQCYSGAFADLMFDGEGREPSGNTCGFFSTSSAERAYGCYPEGHDRDRIGYAFEFIEALRLRSTTAEAQAEVLLSDATPDRPRRTSDVYLERLVAKEAATRGAALDVVADSLLGSAWRHAADWEPEIRLLDAMGDVFGSFSPRSLREVKARQDNLDKLAAQLKLYSSRWTATFTEVKNDLWRAFDAAHPEWRARLDPKRVEALTTEERAALLADLTGELGSFARGRADLWPRLERLRDMATRAKEASWRFEVRTAVTDRMRTILLSIAGRTLLSDTRRKGAEDPQSNQRQAFAALARCEAFDPGALPRSSRLGAGSRPSFPVLDKEIALLEELQPSWLGVRYAAVPPEMRRTYPALANAARIEAVEEGSPAAESGLAAGDVIIGPRGAPAFKSAQDLREWTMLSVRNKALPLTAFRPGANGAEGREFEVKVRLRPYPADRPGVGVPPGVGAGAPPLPETLQSDNPLPDLRGRAHLLFFWATWCGPCKAAIPEVMAFAAEQKLPVVAITDEEPAVVAKFRASWKRPFFDLIAVDSPRKTFIALGVSGTPTIVLVDEKGVIRLRQVGYALNSGLKLDGWRWSPR